MLRRVARTVRPGSLVVGSLLLIIAPISHFCWVELQVIEYAIVRVSHGTISFMAVEPGPRVVVPERTGVHWGRGQFDQRRIFVADAEVIDPPGGGSIRRLNVSLWFLAFFCLAWPVTAFVVARRRAKRGFPIEPKASDSASRLP